MKDKGDIWKIDKKKLILPKITSLLFSNACHVVIMTKENCESVTAKNNKNSRSAVIGTD